MYCPVCFNHTLKLAHSGVVKVSINGKSKPTSQFIFNLKKESQAQIDDRFKAVLVEYFEWYKTLSNIDPIQTIELTSCDFICADGCKLTLNHMLNVIDRVITKKSYLSLIDEVTKNLGIPTKINL